MWKWDAEQVKAALKCHYRLIMPYLTLEIFMIIAIVYLFLLGPDDVEFTIKFWISVIVLVIPCIYGVYKNGIAPALDFLQKGVCRTPLVERFECNRYTDYTPNQRVYSITAYFHNLKRVTVRKYPCTKSATSGTDYLIYLKRSKIVLEERSISREMRNTGANYYYICTKCGALYPAQSENALCIVCKGDLLFTKLKMPKEDYILLKEKAVDRRKIYELNEIYAHSRMDYEIGKAELLKEEIT